MLNRSMFIKFLLSFLIFAVILAGAFWLMDYLGTGEMSLEIVLMFFCIMALYVFVSFFWFVVKPIRSVLSQMQLVMNGKKFKKVYTRRVDEVGVLANFFNQMTQSFTEVADDIQDRNRILDELAVAAELQKEIFPDEVPQLDQLKIVAKNRPATELGGDSYDFIETKDKLYMYVGDVTGHGVTAGLIMAMVNAMIDSFATTYTNARDVMIQTNNHIKKYVKPSMYMTLVMLCWDKAAKKMTYVGGGHEHILVYRKAKGEIDDIVSGGTALGMTEDATATAVEKEILLAPGDLVVLYTDGITEAKNESEELYGLERLKSTILDYGQTYTAAGVSHHIATDLSSFVGDESQIDDMTLIVVEKT
ncbi:SpoIIE family protein phosphatase [Candidatus Peregrinibacteria bacterium]|nr:SpoIIE family protein phosphatase [Candidatus Peregrinibacteria bacterium]MBT4148289.1 SpoIIE family protein phosphatase [Candidatus Peregrinibacteria bacterium]MBT4366426.1 SpoIIE family protein phosphatase [Candidatus Peregrinibacteria bacterium]MBT4456192.1 SpoIIE family protein phosphatase [Candidatus Peregrinibacteria bacterium]